MKLPPFTLVHDPRAPRGPEGRRRLIADSVRGVEPDLRADLLSIKPAMSSTLLKSFALEAEAPARKGTTSALRTVVGELKRQPRVVTAGIWDLDSQVGELPAVVERLNAAQPVFAFFEVQAALPVGLVSRPQRVVAWAAERSAEPLAADAVEEFENNIIFTEFAGRAERIRRVLGIDYLIGITPSMIAFEDDVEIHWNYFTGFAGKIALASTYGMYDYARQARRPFEAAVAGIVVAQLLVALDYPALGFHPEVRGCLFDFNEERDTIVRSLRRARIEPECLAKIQPRYRAAAEAMTAALRAYDGPRNDQP